MTSAPELDSGLPPWLNEYMPFAGPCAFCGGPDKRHRVTDSIIERLRAGDSAASLADDFAVPVEAVLRLAAWAPDDDRETPE